mgnify:CR=1 FL=1
MDNPVIYELGAMRIEHSEHPDSHDIFYRGEPIAFLQRNILRDLVNTDNTSQFREMFERVQPCSNIFEQVQPEVVYHFLAQASIEEEKRYSDYLSDKLRETIENLDVLLSKK